MGVRIVVVLQNDLAHEWALDPNLGKQILAIAQWHTLGLGPYPNEELIGGKVIECCDDSIQSLIALDGYSVHTLALVDKVHGQTKSRIIFNLLKEAARNLGYSIVRNPFRRFR